MESAGYTRVVRSRYHDLATQDQLCKGEKGSKRKGGREERADLVIEFES